MGEVPCREHPYSFECSPAGQFYEVAVSGRGSGIFGVDMEVCEVDQQKPSSCMDLQVLDRDPDPGHAGISENSSTHPLAKKQCVYYLLRDLSSVIILVNLCLCSTSSVASRALSYA